MGEVTRLETLYIANIRYLEKNVSLFSAVVKVWFNAFNDRARLYIGRYSFGHNSPAAAVKEVFKPSTAEVTNMQPAKEFRAAREAFMRDQESWIFFDALLIFVMRYQKLIARLNYAHIVFNTFHDMTEKLCGPLTQR